MTAELNIFFGVAMMILLADSWYIHYKVKDGLARLMLLWGTGLLFGMMFFRTLGYVLYEIGVLDIVTSRTWNQYVIFFVYAIIIGQQYVQRGRAERNEDDQQQKDNKELKKRRKDDR